MNIQGLCPQTIPSKVPFIQDSFCANKELFIGLSETWLQSHKDAELYIEGYTLFRRDSTRKKKSSGRLTGGTACYIRDDIAASSNILLDYSSNCVQILCTYSKKENLVIVTTYRQPDDKYHGNPSSPNDFKIALNRLKLALQDISPAPDIVMGGDYNLPNAIWPHGKPAAKATPDERLMLNDLNEFCNEFLLTQTIHGATHKDGNTLDLVFVNNPELIHEVNIYPVLQSTSHHHVVQCSTSYKVKHIQSDNSGKEQSFTSFKSLNFFHKDIDWEALNEDLNIDWKALFEDKDPDNMLEIFYKKCYEACSVHVPARTAKDSAKLSKVLRYRRSLSRKRKRITQRIARCRTDAGRERLHGELIQIEKDMQISHRSSSKYEEAKAVEAIGENPKYFYSYIKKKSKVKSRIGPLADADGKLTGDNKEMAELLSQQYSKVFSIPKRNIPEFKKKCIDTLSDINFSGEDIGNAIDELRHNAAAGKDGFPAALLKNCKRNLVPPLVLFWRNCLDTGHIPVDLKQSIITPIHKGDTRSAPANYRPVALTSHLIKIFEKVLRNKIIEHFNKNNLFNNSQHGFRAGRSCLSQLLEHVDTLLTMLEDGSNADVVYLDFSKAFDKVDFNIVLNKLKGLGINGKIHSWITAFLTNRSQLVSVNGVLSDPQPVISGVPQGSVLGPLIFLVLIGDIDEDVLYSVIKSFADDTRATKKVNSVEDIKKLQEDLEKIYKWTEDNNMSLNDTKFELLRYGLDLLIKTTTSYTTPAGLLISPKDDAKDLGVIMSNDCSFTKQIDKVITKAKSLISWILRSFKTREVKPMLLLYKSLVLPILEYCSVLWNPTTAGKIKSLDQLQWSFIRKIAGNHGLNYWECLKKHKLYSLERRRERYRIIYIWKILENLVPNINNKISSTTHVRHGRKCRIPIINLKSKVKKAQESSIVFQGVQLFNALPANVRNISNVKLEVFKSSLDTYLAKVYDEPLLTGYTANRKASTNSIIQMANIA